MSQEERDQKRHWWWMAASSAIGRPEMSPQKAARAADELMIEDEKRHGDETFLLDGQTNCAACKEPLEGRERVIDYDRTLVFCSDVCKAATA